MIVEDNKDIAELYRLELKEENIDSFVIDNYLDAARALVRTNPFFIITDGKYPLVPQASPCEDAGLMLCSDLKRRGKDNYILISSSDEIVSRALGFGHKSIMKTSFSIGYLSDLVSKYK